MLEQLKRVERKPDIVSMEKLAHEGLGKWIRPHLDDLMTELPYDPNNRNQWIDRIEIEADPSLEKARYFGNKAMGSDGYDQLVQDFDELGVTDTALSSTRRRASTLIATLHLPNTLDTALTHNALFVSSGDPSVAESNVVLSNFIMSRMQLIGTPVDEILSSSGRQIRALPERAVKYIEPETIERIGRMAVKSMIKTLDEGVILHRALSGTTAKRTVLADGTEAMVIPRIKDTVARSTIKRTPYAFGVPMFVRFGNTSAQVLPMRILKEVPDVHQLMEDMVRTVNELDTQPVYYGQPPEARELRQ